MDIAKTVLKGNFIALVSYIRKEESSQISHLSFYFKKPEKKRKLNTKYVEGRKY